MNGTTGKKMNGCLKAFLIGISTLIGFAIIGWIAGGSEEKENKIDRVEKNEEVSNKKDTRPAIEVIDDVLLAIKNDNGDLEEEVKSNEISGYFFNFEWYSKMYNQYEENKDPKVQKKLAEFKKEIGKHQSRILPKMRKAYVKELKEKLWRNNIDVVDKGTTIELVGGVLANNANKEDMMNAINDIVRKLRFKRVNMKWYKYDDEYTYYSLDTPKDSELY